jgi:hypothetical protein
LAKSSKRNEIYSVKRPEFIHRTAILDGFRALYLAQLRLDPLLKEDGYACGFRDGFEASLRSLAELMGINAEFEDLKSQTPAGSITVLSDGSRRHSSTT